MTLLIEDEVIADWALSPFVRRFEHFYKLKTNFRDISFREISLDVINGSSPHFIRKLIDISAAKLITFKVQNEIDK